MLFLSCGAFWYASSMSRSYPRFRFSGNRAKMNTDVAAPTRSAALGSHRKQTYDSAGLHFKKRILEPPDYGILNGSVQLLGYQFAGLSSRPLPNWLLMKTDEITNLELLGQTFQGGRPTASGKHRKWDKLFIRVAPAADRAHTGSTEPSYS
jgi:hypothetical protein